LNYLHAVTTAASSIVGSLDALRRIARLADEIGIRAVTVDAIDVQARAFYAKFGFAGLLDDELHLFLPVAMIRKLGI